MIRLHVLSISLPLLLSLVLGCSESGDADGGSRETSHPAGVGGSLNGASSPGMGSSGTGSSETGSSGTGSVAPLPTPDDLPPAGVGSVVDVPADGLPEDVSSSTTVIGTGTPESCTSAAFVDAVWQGGVITFNCGPEPFTLELEATADINNKGAQEVVIDGGGLITLSGGGVRRIIYQDVCAERLGWATSDCWGQDFPRLTLQNLTFINGFTDKRRAEARCTSLEAA